ncbi:MAG: Beta-lactamase domain protein [Candidatus Moranbacteria bacterium GW2011_GWE2_35_2-]|nr:MAG: Beta-lactamase domain protein [Candidatus Moranbacteria bacterium GW2011_GWE2_35_2-]KKQ22651.1 MAG: Beta-lactamase domain protein [Candidatus Moranbacteria bacterium GW2011_GWF2_37_11]KKQ29053.1 MAG: Beta-lactamase domain protein [Candidatus Moranbacteria bacterium GW2011_GWD1_37_17]KKQ30411.1 MAG: Beta-lactamase domain protein [Candidatus Moranbacteria bacterium GW2011_GWE1_37_24]HBO16587.1 ribonuclease J [Candidatus Moranbacteria bacterium]
MTDNKKERERSSEKGRVVSSSKKRRPDGSSAKSRKGGRRKTDGRTMPSRVGQMVSHEGAARRKTQAAPAVIENKLRIIPLGGQEEVGRNMTVFEYGEDIVLVDMGVQFPEEDMPGIDYIIPNVSYLKGKEKRIRAVVFTHGHLDHIGAAPILLNELGYPPVIGRELTLALVKRKMEDQEPGSSVRLKTVSIKTGQEKVRLGNFQLKFFDVEHSIMDSIGVVLFSPSGSVVHMGDWTMDTGANKKEGTLSYEFLRNLPKPSILMMESLGALNNRPIVSDEDMWINLRKIIDGAPGRLIIGTFSSQVKRIKDIINYAESVGKKVALDGFSMKANVEVAKQLGYIKASKDTMIEINRIHDYPDSKVLIVCTGAQGEVNAVLSRIVTENHRFVKLKKTDTIIFSSSVIPGNERTIQRLKDNLYRKCDNVIHNELMDVHVSGHNNIQAIKELVRQVQPTYVLPVYANHYFLKEAKKVVAETGFPEKNIFILDNGNVLKFDVGKIPELEKNKVDTNYVFIDGLGVGDVGQVVLRDRQVLAEDGMFVITVIVDGKTKEIVGNIQITSRGFIYVKENFDLVNSTKNVVKKVIKENTSRDTSINWDLVKKNIRESVGSFLFQKTERRPMVLPVVIEV